MPSHCLLGERWSEENKNHGSQSGRDFYFVIETYASDLLIALMHFVHKTLCILRPFSNTRVFCRFGLNVRFVARWENERLWPKAVFLPQVAHLAIL